MRQLFLNICLQGLLDFLGTHAVEIDRIRDVVGDRLDLHPVSDFQFFNDLVVSLRCHCSILSMSGRTWDDCAGAFTASCQS
jgi:hypothetical protein